VGAGPMMTNDPEKGLIQVYRQLPDTVKEQIDKWCLDNDASNWGLSVRDLEITQFVANHPDLETFAFTVNMVDFEKRTRAMIKIIEGPRVTDPRYVREQKRTLSKKLNDAGRFDLVRDLNAAIPIAEKAIKINKGKRELKDIMIRELSER
jgi:hypothetical protein